MGSDINELEVEITADADEAVEAIDQVTEALERLAAAAEDANLALEELGGSSPVTVDLASEFRAQNHHPK